MHKLLLVDDERNILKSLNRLLSHESYEVLMAGSGAEALELLDGTPVSLIISDMRMPEMDGVEFLIKAKKKQPDAVRMVLSGYSDIDAVMKAVNEGDIWRYITKPWEDNDLMITVANAIEFYEKDQDRKRLLSELQSKNEELAKMNATLAEKVAERTWELEARGRILSLIIEDADIETVASSVNAFVARLSGAGSILVTAPFMEREFSYKREADEDSRQLAKYVYDNCETSISDSELGIPLTKGGQVYGALVLRDIPIGKLNELLDSAHNFASLLTLAFSQRKASIDAPALLKSIDKLLGA